MKVDLNLNSIALVNVILFAFIIWISWMGNTHLAGQLDPQMQSDVMIQKYQLVCSRLTASMTAMALLVLVLINGVLIGPHVIMTVNSALKEKSSKRPEHPG